jgi:exopolysaccharide biosynthesis protein
MILADVFNSAIGSSRYTSSYDLNDDGAINMSDVMIVAGNFNKTVTAATPTLKPTSTQTLKPTPVPTVNVSPQIDDWNYISSTKSIKIQKVTKGSGKTIVTYYVADVKINDDSTVLSAFANNTYGRGYAETTSKMAKDNNAIFAINGDYYGFRRDGIVIRNGKLYREVPVRNCLIIYKNGLMETAFEKSVSTSTLLANGAQQVLSFGPVLVKSGTALTNFEYLPSDQGPTYLLQAHPRAGMGMIEPNHFIFIVVDGRAPGYSEEGMTMVEFAKTFKDLGCKEAYNLDGGGSATMYFNGRVVNKPLGTTTERSISDILYIKK